MAALNRFRAGEGEPMVLIHGLGSSLEVWSAVRPALERRHDVLAIDLPSFGNSPPLPGDYTGPALADAVEAELDAAGFDRPHVVGNSLGGYLAAELARRGRARSGVAISPWGLETAKENAYSMASLRALRASTKALSPYVDTLARFAPARFFLALQGFGPRGWRLDPDALAHAVRAFASAPGFGPMHDWMTRNGAEGLEGIDCPFLVLWGTWDLLLPVRQAARWGRLVPDAQVRKLPRVGHAPMSEVPERIAPAILDFVASAPRERAAAPA